MLAKPGVGFCLIFEVGVCIILFEGGDIVRITFDVPESVARYMDMSDSGYQLKVQELIMFDLVR